jgi:hypothetical protein
MDAVITLLLKPFTNVAPLFVAAIRFSLARDNRTFQGLPLHSALAAKNTDARGGLIAVNLASGEIAAWVRREGVVRELYDVVFLPGVRQPAAIGFKADDITRLISVDEATRPVTLHQRCAARH